LRQIATDSEPDAAELVESRLAAAGYRDEDDYPTLWAVAGTTLFDVRDDFPAIRSGSLPTGVHHVVYSLSLNDLAPFEVEESVLSGHPGVHGE
jgi:hypothetical protein